MASRRARSASSPASKSGGEVAGIELDGTRATVVALTDGVASVVRSFTSDTGMQALREAVSSLRPGEPVRICLATPSATAALMEVTSALDHRAAFTREALRALSAPESSAVSAVLTDPDSVRAGRVSPALAVALPAEQVASAYEVLESFGRTGEVVSVPATACALEGLSLAVRGRLVDLCLVRRGQPMAYHCLQSPGVEALVAGLGGQAARSRVMSAMAGELSDPLAAAEVARWVEALASEVADTVSSWRAGGLAVPSEVIVYGSGASTAGLPAALKRHGLGLAQTDLVRMLGPASTRNSSRLEPISALLAAMSYGSYTPASVYVSRSAVVAARRRASAKSRRTVAVTSMAALALVVVPSLVPMAVSQARTAFLTWRTDATLTQLASSKDATDLVNTAVADYAAQVISQAATGLDERVAVLTDKSLASKFGLQVVRVESTSGPVAVPATVTARVSTPVGSEQNLDKWRTQVLAALPGTQMSVDEFSSDGSVLSAAVSLTSEVSK